MQKEHHKRLSPFCSLPIDIVDAFPVDYMHQSCLGVMNRLLLMWLRGPKRTRLSAQQASQISERLKKLRFFMPSVFARKPRSVDMLDQWKATEFRQFLLYTEKIVLKNILPKDLYEHFLYFSVALCIFVSPSLTQGRISFAHKLLLCIVEKARLLYGPEFLVYNVHSLLHLHNFRQFKSLDQCSAFPFENYIQQLKKLVRSGKSPLAQIVKRLDEINKCTIKTTTKNSVKKVSTKNPDNMFLVKKSIVEVKRLVEVTEESRSFLCRIFSKKQPMFCNSCDSTLLGVCLVNKRDTLIKIIPEKELHTKGIMVDGFHLNESIFMTL